MPRTLTFLLAAATSMTAVVPQFVQQGFTHIVPHGWDHVFFILGLFLVARDLHTLLFQVTLFTLAHSFSLGLAHQGLVVVPSKFVEIGIGLSIAFIAAENLFHERLSKWRPTMVVLFGLIHGLGFAHSFDASQLAVGALLPALFSFNIGIELGQLTVIAAAYALTAVWWSRDWYQSLVTRPASVMIACVGLYLAVQRSFSL